MFHLITGGSGSGKSAYAEDRILQYHKGRAGLYYIATMEPFGAETQKKIERHRQMRRGKGFETLECYTDLIHFAEKSAFSGASVLLECMSNLTANEVYHKLSVFPSEDALADEIFWGVEALVQKCQNVVVVTNEVASECVEDTPEMQCYKRVLARINCQMAGIADKVTEVVYGIPVTVQQSLEPEDTEQIGIPINNVGE